MTRAPLHWSTRCRERSTSSGAPRWAVLASALASTAACGGRLASTVDSGTPDAEVPEAGPAEADAGRSTTLDATVDAIAEGGPHDGGAPDGRCDSCSDLDAAVDAGGWPPDCTNGNPCDADFSAS